MTKGTVAVKKGKLYTVIYEYENGKRREKWKSTGLDAKSSKSKAKAILQERIWQYEQNKKFNLHNTNSDTLFADYVNLWLDYVKNKVDISTYEGYVSIARNHVIPYFKNDGSSIGEITRRKLQEFFDTKSQKGRIDGKGGLSVRSLQLLKNIIHQTLNLCIKDEIINTNPCTLIDLPRYEHREQNFYTADELKTLLSAISDEFIYPAIKIIAFYGLRRSELLGLKWDCIDFERNVFIIKHTVVNVNTTVYKDKTKSQTSRRTLVMCEPIKDLFLELKQKEAENRKFFGNSYFESDYIFKWDDGHPISPNYLSTQFNKVLKKYGFRHIRLHDLRHSCASVLLSSGKGLKDVEDLLGHSQISMTADLYGHLDFGRKREISETMAVLIG